MQRNSIKLATVAVGLALGARPVELAGGALVAADADDRRAQALGNFSDRRRTPFMHNSVARKDDRSFRSGQHRRSPVEEHGIRRLVGRADADCHGRHRPSLDIHRD